jgi:hypothetical protein
MLLSSIRIRIALCHTPKRATHSSFNYISTRFSHTASNMSPSSVLIIGAQRGLGTALTKRYGELVGSSGKVFATSEKPVDPGKQVSSRLERVDMGILISYRTIIKVRQEHYRH